MRLAFYAPLKAPGHPVPSGDRAIARLILAALRRAGAARGWEVDLVSTFRSFDGAGDADRQRRLRDVGSRLAGRLIRRYRDRPADRPALWFTYHLYHKAPDWLGPAVSTHLGIPYVVAEASHAAKQRGGPWSIGHEAAARAIRRADVLLVLNRDDLAGVRPLVRDPAQIQALPLFLAPGLGAGGALGGESELGPDPPGRARPTGPPEACDEVGLPATTDHPARVEARARIGRRWGVPVDVPWLLCVAMMRGGRKLASFEMLAAALARAGLAAEGWHLVVAGDGPARSRVEEAISGRLPAERYTFTGRVEGETLARLYAGSELFVWPAVGEPMGMAMLEAQGHGLPVVAARTRGVPDLVQDGVTGRLVPEADAAAFADAVQALLRAPERRRRMSRAARGRVAREHGFEAASERLGGLVGSLVGRSARRGGAGGAARPEPPVPGRVGGRKRSGPPGPDAPM